MTTQLVPPAGIQIMNDGAVIRVEKNGKTLLVAKEQVKTIDTVHENIVRIDIGEGALKNIFLNYQDVTVPAVASANELRDTIKGMMLSDQYDGGDAKESTQLSILEIMQQLGGVLTAIGQNQLDPTKGEPSRIDESNPNTIYRGWHRLYGVPDSPEWAIERVRQVNDEIISEWAFGTKRQNYHWTTRETLNYAPYDHDLPVESPLPQEIFLRSDSDMPPLDVTPTTQADTQVAE